MYFFILVKIFSSFCQNLDDRGRLFWDCHTHTFHIASCLQTNFHIKISNLVLENQSLEKSFLEKKVFGKTVFVWKKDFCQNIVQVFLVLIYDHTLIFTSPRTLFCSPLSKEFLSKFTIFKKPLGKIVLA